MGRPSLGHLNLKAHCCLLIGLLSYPLCAMSGYLRRFGGCSKADIDDFKGYLYLSSVEYPANLWLDFKGLGPEQSLNQRSENPY